MRLTMNPGVSLAGTGVLPIWRARLMAFSMVAGLVRSPRMISTRAMSGGGLKKCIPTTRSGCRAAEGIEFFKHVALEVELLRGCLDDQRAFPEILQPERADKPLQDLLLFLGGHFSSRPAPLEKAPDPAQPIIYKLLRDIIEKGLEACLSTDLGDTGPHGAGAQHAYS